MKTPITDRRAFNVCPWKGTHDLNPKGTCIDANTARRLELDRAALMAALEAVHRVSAMGSEEEAIAWTALSAARANFPEQP